MDRCSIVITHFPERLYACGKNTREDIKDTKGINYNKGDWQTHRDQHDPKSGADFYQFQKTEGVFLFNRVEQRASSENPPGIA
jgi:hypothetical protein